MSDDENKIKEKLQEFLQRCKDAQLEKQLATIESDHEENYEDSFEAELSEHLDNEDPPRPATREEMLEAFQRTMLDRALLVVETYARHRNAIEEVISSHNLPDEHHLHRTAAFFEELMKYQVSLIPSEMLPQA